MRKEGKKNEGKEIRDVKIVIRKRESEQFR